MATLHPVDVKLVIIGAGGFGREVLDVIDAINDARGGLSVLGFVDDGTPEPEHLIQRGAAYLGPVAALADLPTDVRFVIAIGSGSTRRRIDEWATSCGREPATLVHPSASMGYDVQLGPGTVVCSHASLTTNIRTGRHVHINLNSTVGHDSVLGDYVTVFPLAAISGSVRLDDEVSVGTGAAIIQGISVGKRAIIGAAAGVVRDIPPDVIAVGVPAKPRVIG